MTYDAATTPDAEIEIDAGMARGLLQVQCPELADLPIQIVEAGWDNVMVRLGDDLAMRLPRRAIADGLLLNEQKWLPALSAHLPLPIPAPLQSGVPTEDYPFHWSILPWFVGEAADIAPPIPEEAPILADFLRRLHDISLPEGAPANPHRDCPLSGKRADTERRMKILQATSDVITPQILAMWRAGLEAPLDLPKSWIAGDIHARNVLVDAGKLSAFIDWGDMCAGDPATDLASIWALFESHDARNAVIEAYEMSAATCARARGWAVFFGVILMETGLRDTPRHAEMGRKTLLRLQEDA